MKLLKKICRFIRKLLFVSFCFCVGFGAFVVYQMRGFDKPGFDVTQYKVSDNSAIHPLLPFTTWEHIKPCGAYLNESAEFTQSLSCTNLALAMNGDPYDLSTEAIPIPACYVITADAGDVVRSGLVNVAVLKYGPMALGAILGFFDPESYRIFIVENIDMDEVYRHEVQHYLLTLVGLELEQETVHTHLVWDVCESRTYSPSQKVLDLEDLLLKNEEEYETIPNIYS